MSGGGCNIARPDQEVSEVIKNNGFVLVSSNSTDRASFDLSYRNQQESGGGFMCGTCRTIRPEPGPIGTVVIQGVITDAPFGVIDAGLGLARREFLFSLGEENVERYFHVAKVISYKGNNLDNWVAYRAKHHHVVRAGKENAGYKFCKACGSFFYFSQGGKYLYPAPPLGIEVFGKGGVSIDFVTTYQLANKLKKVVEINKWRRVEFTELPILDAPLDGLGEIANQTCNKREQTTFSAT